MGNPVPIHLRLHAQSGYPSLLTIEASCSATKSSIEKRKTKLSVPFAGVAKLWGLNPRLPLRVVSKAKQKAQASGSADKSLKSCIRSQLSVSKPQAQPGTMYCTASLVASKIKVP